MYERNKVGTFNQNNGRGALILLGVNVDGDFSLLTNQVGTCNEMRLLGRGQSCHVEVTYTGVWGEARDR